MWDGIILRNQINFICSYITIKALISCFLSLFVMLLVPVIRRINKRRSILIDYNGDLLVLPMLFAGMSRLMYLRYTVRVYGMISWVANTSISRVYAVGAGILFAVYIIRCRRHRADIRALRTADTSYDGLIRRAADTVFGRRDTLLRRLCADRIIVYIADGYISPYSGGILRPYIVMPDINILSVSEREYYIMLCHEYMHHRKGHILWLSLYDMACVYWWFNPLIYLYREIFKDDMELMCDNACIELEEIGEKEYAGTVLCMAAAVSRRIDNPVTAFFTDGYKSLRKRITAIAGHNRAKGRDIRAIGSIYDKRTAYILPIILMLAITLTSYPRYTRLKEYGLYVADSDSTVKLIEYDSERLQSACRVKDGCLEIVDKELFGTILKDNAIRDEYVYLSFDGIMKVPGVGGGGDVGMINTSDYDDIFYIAADTLYNRIMVLILKLI